MDNNKCENGDPLLVIDVAEDTREDLLALRRGQYSNKRMRGRRALIP